MYRHKYHIMPPEGWLNDPNGCCYYNGKYHVFFQYSPGQPEGGDKYWGHYISEDFANWEYIGIAVSPDNEYDCNGAYSGGAFVEDGLMEVFYTGNVKHPGNYDYINEGRGHNVLGFTSEDGIHLSDKAILLVNADYPEDMSCHVRDPKVWKEDNTYYMLLGARTKSSKPAMLLYSSKDKKNWELAKTAYADEALGFMLECPDYFQLNAPNLGIGGQATDNENVDEGQETTVVNNNVATGKVTVVAASPQGIEHERTRFQNEYAAGYFLLPDVTTLYSPESILEPILKKDNFQEWDMGFDYYAPQSFLAKDGRRIIIGWAGVPDTPYDNAPSVAEGWQHSLTVPAELTYANHHIYRNPIRELELLHDGAKTYKILDNTDMYSNTGAYDLQIEDIDVSSTMQIKWNDDLVLSYNKDTKMLALTFTSEAGSGRDARYVDMSTMPSDGDIKDIRILQDVSLVEIYINSGEVVLTTRYYAENPEEISIEVIGVGEATATLWNMKEAIR